MQNYLIHLMDIIRNVVNFDWIKHILVYVFISNITGSIPLLVNY
jgi:hypothetical protein